MKRSDLALGVLIAAIWGLNFTVIEIGLEHFPPLFLSALRFLIVASLIVVVPRPSVSWPTILGIGLVLGVMKFSLLFVGMNEGMGAASSSVVLQVQAIFTIALAAILLRERPSWRQVSGGLLSLGGLSVIFVDHYASPSVLGLLLVIAAGAAWAVANLLIKRSRASDMLSLVVWMSLVPPVPLFLMSLLFEGDQAIALAVGQLSWSSAGVLLYLALLSTVFAYWGWGRLLSRYPAGTVAPLALLVPVFGITFGTVLLQEAASAATLVASAAIVAGLCLTTIRRLPQPAVVPGLTGEDGAGGRSKMPVNPAPKVGELLSGIPLKPRNGIFALKLLGYIAMIGIGAWGSLAFDWMWSLPFQVLLGLGFVHGVELQHQALHYTGFSSRWPNRVAGVVLGIPMFVSFSAYQARHLHHHRWVGTAKDRQFFNYGDGNGRSLMPVLRHLLMTDHYAQVIGHGWSLARRAFSGPPLDDHERRVALESTVAFAILAALTAVSIVTLEPIVLTAWIIPLLLFASPMHALVEFPEHYGCERDTRDITRNTRSIRSGPVATWFTNGNNLHVEHHLHPGLPVESLAKLHARLWDFLAYKNPTYRDFYAGALREMLAPRRGSGESRHPAPMPEHVPTRVA